MPRSRDWVWTDPYITLIEPGNSLYDWIEKIGNLYAGFKTLFLIDDIIANENLDNRSQLLSELAISGRHRAHSLWLLTWSYRSFLKILGDKHKCSTFGTLKTEQT